MEETSRRHDSRSNNLVAYRPEETNMKRDSFDRIFFFNFCCGTCFEKSVLVYSNSLNICSPIKAGQELSPL